MAADGSFTTVGFNLRGQKVTDTDAVGQGTDYGYDNLGHLVSVTQAAVLSSASASLRFGLRRPSAAASLRFGLHRPSASTGLRPALLESSARHGDAHAHSLANSMRGAEAPPITFTGQGWTFLLGPEFAGP